MPAIAAEDVERILEARRKALLLNGPQRTGEAVEQSQVDALFG